MSQSPPSPHTPENEPVPTETLVREVAAALAAGAPQAARSLVEDLRAPDIADVIELLDPEDRVELIEAFGADFDFEVFSELDETVRDQLSEALPNEFLARAITELDTDDAAYIIEGLEDSDKEDVLSQLETSDRAALERNLEYPEETAGRLMQAHFVAVAPFWTVGQVIDYMREADDLPESFSEIFVVDPSFRVLGSVELSRVLRAKRNVLVETLMETDRHVVIATEDQEEVARQFKRYDLFSVPVVDENQRLVGVVTVDDVVEVLDDEADEDMKALAGVGDESLADSVLETVKSRVPWLVVNLGTAILASFVIQQFDASIEQMVALTVTVRALATSKLGSSNARRVVTREALVGLMNGLVLSSIMAAVVFLWFGSSILGGVIGAAIIVNLFCAAVAGILIPLIFDHFELDPAPASGVFVTMVTDCVGFFAFLGLASIWLF
ncbi:MAG: magnesium transporter [Hyphomicrobium sp. 12-62-95]|nr:MAG: magnesium transporter [Hyphomicrobium sp. 12-62-95]